MKRTTILSLAALAVAASALFAFLPEKPHSAPVGPAAAMTVADWERAKAFTLEYVNAASDEAIAFKPTPEMRSFGQQMLHLAEANFGMASMASGKPTTSGFGMLEKTADQYKTKEALAKVVGDSYDFVIAAAKSMDEKKSAEIIKVFNMFDISRAAALDKAFEHQTHHRGQATVYLRLKGIKPPDEKLF